MFHRKRNAEFLVDQEEWAPFWRIPTDGLISLAWTYCFLGLIQPEHNQRTLILMTMNSIYNLLLLKIIHNEFKAFAGTN